MIGVKKRVVVGVDDLRVGAVAKLGRAAIRGEFTEFVGIAQIIGRPVAAHLVQHDDAVPGDVVEPGVELVEEDIVAAFPAGAEAAVIGGGQVEIGDAVGHVLAAGIVVQPCRTDPGMDENIHDVFIGERLLWLYCERGNFENMQGMEMAVAVPQLVVFGK